MDAGRLAACSPEGALVPERARLVTVTAPARPAAPQDAPKAGGWQPAAAGDCPPGRDAGAGGEPGQPRGSAGLAVEQSRSERLEEASALLDRLIAALTAAQGRANRHVAGARTAHAAGLVNVPASESLIGDAELVGWLRRLTGAPVGSPRYEQELAQRTDPDWFALRALPSAPPFLRGTDPAALRPELVAPWLRRLSMTRPAPTAQELSPAALAAEPGPVTRMRRGTRARRWGQPPRSGAPLLPAETVIPHVVHGIWLGGPLAPGSRFARNFAAAARRYAGQLDFVVWTDVPRGTFDEAARIPPGGDHDPLKPARAMLAWARRHGIHLLSIHEVFHAGQPMLLHAQYTAELAKLLPRGYCGASDHLRMEIIYRFGGAYVDGDNKLDTDASGRPLCGTLPGLFADVAASVPGFTLHLNGNGLNGDVVIAPARHPALRLLLEMARASYFFTQRQLLGGTDQMARRFAGRPAWLRWRRYTVPRRLGWVMSAALGPLGFSVESGLLARSDKAIAAGSELSWSRAEIPANKAALTHEQVTDRVVGAVATLARQLYSREGDLHLTAVAPVIAALPDPGAAWIAILALFAQLIALGAISPVTSVTQFRWADDGTAERVALPPEAEAVLDRIPAGQEWLGSGIAAPGQPAWLLDEAVTPARLRWPPFNLCDATVLRRGTQTITDASGVITGIRVPEWAGRPDAAGTLPMPAGYLAVHVNGHLGQPWAGQHPIPPEILAVVLADLGVADRHIVLVNQATAAGGCPALHDYGARLASLLGQPVLAADGMAAVPQPAAPGPASAAPADGGPGAGGLGVLGVLAPASSEALASGASVLADAMMAARNLPGLLATGREAYRLAGEQLAEPQTLLLAMDTRLAARLLADAEIMNSMALSARHGAQLAARNRVLMACLALAGPGEPRLPGGLGVTEAAAAASAVAGLLAVNSLLNGHRQLQAVASWQARLRTDPRTQREIKALRQRIARARRRLQGSLPATRTADGDVMGAVRHVAGRVTAEMAAGRWPGLADRLELLGGAARQVCAAAAIRVAADAVAQYRLAAAPDARDAAAKVLAAVAPDRCGAAGEPYLRRRLELLRERRLKRSAWLLDRLRRALSTGVAGGPAVAAETERPVTGQPAEVMAGACGGPADSAEMTQWLARLIGLPVGTPEYENDLARRLGPDLFALREPPPPPSCLAGFDPVVLTAGRVAPFLRRLSMTGPAPAAGDLAPEALDADAGPVSRRSRSARARRWGQPPTAAAPQLPPETAIPHVVHAIWLGGPLRLDHRFARNLAAAVRRYGDQADFALWTDVPRRCFEAARDSTPRPPGQPDPLAPARGMLAWARRLGIHVISVHEVFHAGHPMRLAAEYAAEMARQLPRGYAGASDLLRLEIINRFGGAYVDGDNLLGADADGRPLPGTLSGLFTEVATSGLGFTFHILPPGRGLNNDVIIAPARHPAIRLYCEAARVKYRTPEPVIFGGLEEMSQRYVGTNRVLLRYPLVYRTGRTHHAVRSMLGLSLDDARLPRVGHVITYCSDVSWGAPPSAPPPLTTEQVTARAARAVAALAQQLIARPGDLHLPSVAPVIAALPDPGAAWIAILTLLAELIAAGTVPPVTSVTQFRWADDGAAELIALPPEAEAMLAHRPAVSGWLGSALAAPGQPAWLLDEAVVPATLRWPSPPPLRLPTLRRITKLITNAEGATTGLRLGTFGRPAPHASTGRLTGSPAVRRALKSAPPQSPGSPPVAEPALPGYLSVQVEGHLGQVWAGQHPVTAEDLALLLCDLGMTGRPVLLINQGGRAGSCPALHPYAVQLSSFLSQPVLIFDGMTRGPQQARAVAKTA
jgi:hypothetical protein